MVLNSERFDALFLWMDERLAVELLLQDVSILENPGVKYIAATLWSLILLHYSVCFLPLL